MSIGAIVGIAIGGFFIVFILGVLIWFWSSYNSFVKKKNNCEEAFSTMDIYLNKRYDLIPNLVSTVKGYAKHEKETLEKVTEARNIAKSATTIDEKIAADKRLTSTLSGLFMHLEAYPDLKANQSFLNLQETLEGIEIEIANSRKYYNATVKDFNNQTEMFPSSIIANMFKFTKKQLYEIDDKTRENVKVEF